MRKLLIGYAISPQGAYGANLSLDEFISIRNSIYFQANTPCIFHGLKRIWEFLDERGLDAGTQTDKDLNINKIGNTYC